MTDTAVKTPNKRKSLPKQVSAKKPKLENGNPKTPQQKGNNTNKNLTPKNKSPKGNNVQNSNKKANKGNNESKKLKPFVGTTGLTEKKPKGKQNIPKTDSKGEGKKGKRRGMFKELLTEAAEAAKDKSKQPAVIKKINNKISEIESRGELTKSSRRKLGLLKKCIHMAKGQATEPKPQKREKTVSQARRDRRKNTAAKGEDKQVKSNENKKGKQNKQAKKQKEEEESDDEVEEDESDVEVEEAEDDSGEEKSDEEESNEEESDEEEIEVPKVSNKKLKLVRKK